ncbi:UNVERIFIED_CONTAM: hypothetical protein K2H54_022705 [Gekko kuhli]
MQTIGSLFSECLENKNGVPMISKDGLNQLVTEMFPHCEKEQINPGVYEIKIPLNETSAACSPINREVSRDEIITSIRIGLGEEAFSENIDDEINLRAESTDDDLDFKIELVLLIR